MSLPPGPSQPRPVQGVRFLRDELALMRDCRDRYGDVFHLRLPGLPSLVVVADPALLKTVFASDATVLHAGEGNVILEPVVGPSSVLLLDEKPHLRQRKLMLPPFHGDRMRAYGELMGEIAAREVERWPVGKPFALHPRMQEVTLEIIVRTVFGVEEGERHDRLSALLRRMLDLGTTATMWMGIVPATTKLPWPRFKAARRDLDALLYDEIARRRDDPGLGDRVDVLSLLVQARDEAGEPMTDAEIRDELLTLLVAGHETTATALAWAFERLLRHPAELARLRDELADDDAIDAVVQETLRVRPVLHFAMRQVVAPFRLGEFDLPPGIRIGAGIPLIHERADLYDDPLAFRPARFRENPPETYGWVPFGGGIRRCLGAAFAGYEMRIVLRTVLERCELSAPDPAPERRRRRAITFVPGRGARVVLERRLAPRPIFATSGEKTADSAGFSPLVAESG